MLHAYGIRNSGFFEAPTNGGNLDLSGAVWIDVVGPTPDEDKRILAGLGIDIPTREEMGEIEPSSRLYEEAGALYMTALVTWNIETEPQNTPVAFVVTPKHLVTVRFAEPQPFRSFAARCAKQPRQVLTSDTAFVTLMEVVVDRAADLLERSGADLDAVSGEIFRVAGADAVTRRRAYHGDLESVVQRIGRQYDLASKVRESLVSLGRVAAFFRQAAESWMLEEVSARLRAVERDLRALAEHDSYLSQKTNFLLDATLGLINNEQNKIIKIFSVVAVIFLPPTLVASIYGMNFQIIPELKWIFGYPWSLALMVLSAVLPYLYFKRRGWL
jgi:magnesium transporter